MGHRIRLSPALFGLTMILATAIRFPAIWCQEIRAYDVCGKSARCGNDGPELVYPFWGLDRPPYCGRMEFQLTCQSNVLLLRYESLNYRVLQIDGTTQTINLARNDLWSNFCPQYLYNTTYDDALYNGDNFDQENVSLYYGCDPNIGAPLADNYKFDCAVNDTDTNNYFVRTNQISSNMVSFLGQCNSHITVPVSRSSADQLALPTPTTNDLRSALTAGFNLQWKANNSECEQCTQSGGVCGSNSTLQALFVCYCASGNFSLTCDNRNPPRSKGSPAVDLVSKTGSNRAKQKRKLMRKLVIGLSSGVAGILLLLFVTLCLKKRLWPLWETRKATNHQIEMFLSNYGTLAPKRYKYSEIKRMTNSFVEKLGQGGYGSVYKGQLPDGHLVAVKLLGGATGDGEDFVNEVASISRTSHVNVVTLLGFCFEGKKRALVYEFMPNGSLDKFLHSNDESTNSRFHLDWNTLFQIAKGIARGLEYLHQGCNTRIVHFDIKPHNILLDQEFVPKIADFGLAKLCKRKESIVSIMGARGTAGYIAPEVFFKSFGGASHKSDVYSYGMMVLEMTGSSKNNNVRATSASTSTSEAYFPDWICKQVEEGDNLGVYGLTTKEEDELARKMMMVSLWCIQSDPSDRPSISKVVEMLEGSLQSLQIPPRHFWSSPTRPPQGSSLSATHCSTNERVITVHTS